jgi:hypothetical protein
MYTCNRALALQYYTTETKEPLTFKIVFGMTKQHYLTQIVMLEVEHTLENTCLWSCHFV